ncbi:DUF3347 domain-containing protein [uncultured Pontibacter sp.]|uniref:DUF3347 domain-containing protein n=1 Tax=uncultured Pontibacter sp. TaxID=453356 RepID=UPI00262EAA22|nr:DUF3347 domain-containing protein [uncultured Pontibacter sp.]
MKKTLFAAAVLAAFTFSSCSENTSEKAEATTEQHSTGKDRSIAESAVVVEAPDFSSVAAPMKTQVAQLVEEYLKLTEALVASEPAAAKTAANDVLTVAKAMPVATLTTDEKAFAEEKTNTVIENASKIAESEDLAVQRQNLEQLSETVFSMAKAFNAAEGTLYYQYCPMAFNNKGAYWLSSNEEIRNPYYGDAMLSCGTNEEIYKK